MAQLTKRHWYWKKKKRKESAPSEINQKRNRLKSCTDFLRITHRAPDVRYEFPLTGWMLDREEK
jgi:hypothetical protein